MMTDKSILLTYGGQALHTLPEDVRRRIVSRPRLRKAFDAQARVAGLLALKRFEIPDPALAGRLSHRVQLRIRNRDFPLDEAPPEMMPEWARMVAVVVFMLGLSVFTHREMLSADDPGLPVASTDPAGSTLGTPSGEEAFTFHHADPFTTLVSNPQGAFPLFNEGLRQQVQDSFDIRPLLETNRNDRLSLVPVRQNLP